MGRFELANGGTLLLDELGEISPAMQAKLLRVLQEDEFERVGGQKTLQVDVRVLAATNRDLTREVAAGRFREDLYYRLHVLPLHLAPLRDRVDDIIPLARRFAEMHARRNGIDVPSFTGEALERLVGWSWPGNVRELENVVQRAVILCTTGTIDIPDLMFGAVAGGPAALDFRPALDGRRGLPGGDRQPDDVRRGACRDPRDAPTHGREQDRSSSAPRAHRAHAVEQDAPLARNGARRLRSRA
jgi:DNA-binding NtrC family response regulator